MSDALVLPPGSGERLTARGAPGPAPGASYWFPAASPTPFGGPAVAVAQVLVSP